MEEYFTVSEAAREYKRSTNWFYDQIKEGRISTYSITGNGKIYLSRKEVKEFFTPKKDHTR